MLVALVPAVPLHVFIPLQMRFFQSTIASGQPLMYTASEILSKFSFHFHHFLGQPLLLRCHGCSEDSKISRTLRRQNGCNHLHISKERMASQKHEKFHEKKSSTQYKKKSHCIFYQTQGFIRARSFRKKERWKQTSRPFTSRHSIPSHLTRHHHTGEATP